MRAGAVSETVQDYTLVTIGHTYKFSLAVVTSHDLKNKKNLSRRNRK
jgi:hypothetical protein